MKQMLIAGTPEHMEFCQDFVHFDTFGTMRFQSALEHLENGLLSYEEISVFPLSETLTVIELTSKGRKALKGFRRIWNELYLPNFKEQDWTLRDAYEVSQGSPAEFALSRERFEKERKAGKLATVIAQCPPIELL